MADLPSPSVPVESREQPSDDAGGWEIKPETGELRRYVKAELLDEANATIRGLRAEVADHEKRWQQRADLITRTSELRRRAAALEAEAEAMPARYLEALGTVTAERDRARDLAAHLEEQLAENEERLEAVEVALSIDGDVHDRGLFDEGIQAACGRVRRAIADPQSFLNSVPRAALAAHLEAEPAEEQK